MQGSKSKQELSPSTLVGAQPLLGEFAQQRRAARADKQMALCKKFVYGPRCFEITLHEGQLDSTLFDQLAALGKVQAAQECLAHLSDRQRAT